MLVLLLGVLIIYLFFYGRIPQTLLITAVAICLIAGVIYRCVYGRHEREDTLTMVDYYAVNSGLSGVNPGLKILFFVLVLISVLSVGKWVYAAFACVTMCLIVTLFGGVPVKAWFKLMSVPVTFILLSCVALLLDFSPSPSGIINLKFFSYWIILTQHAQKDTLLILIRSIAAISCLYALSFTTPLYDITEVLRRVHVPKLMIELMFLIYRYIFVLSAMLHELHTAAESRLGYNGFGAGFRTASGTLFSLLAGSFSRASYSFDAMESRCYNGTLCFYRTEKPVCTADVVKVLVCCAGFIVVLLIERFYL